MLQLFNTMTREVEKFTPLAAPKVTFYSCGPTVYDFAHVGNLRAYIFNDILKRVLLYNDFDVVHVMNITDVGHLTGDGDDGEDKMEKSARLESRNAWEIADFYTEAFKSDLNKLNIITPTIWSKATDHIAEQIALVQVLEKKGFIYRTDDGMYFDTEKFPEYGKLARLNLAGQEEGARVEINTQKKNPHDFAVWKFSYSGGVSFDAAQDAVSAKRQMEWESPWGIGFPGWHLECSAMSMKYLGETIDIHTGGIDHIPVHHTNEIAQSEAATGKQFVRYWLHSDFLVVNEGKMSKSLNNFLTLSALAEKGFSPMVYRFFCLSSHYRSKLNFSFEALENAKNGLEKLQRKFLDLGQISGVANTVFLQQFVDNINDDLKIPQALAVLWDLLKSDLTDADKRATMLEFDRIFGLGLADLKDEVVIVPAEIQKLVEERNIARQNKKWDKADEIRQEIDSLGWQVEDTTDSVRVYKKD